MKQLLARMLLLLISSMLLLVGPVAAEWRITPSIGAGVLHSSNASMTPIPADERTIDGIGVKAGAEFMKRSQISTFSIAPRIRVERYDSESRFDTEDMFLKLRYEREGLRSNFSLRGDWESEALRTGELSNIDFDIEDPDEIPDDDAGVTFSTGDRRRLRLVPQWTYEAGQRTGIELRLALTDTDYDNVDEELVTGHTVMRLTGGVNYALTPRDTLGVEAYVRRNSFDNDRDDVDGNGIAAKFRREISETTTLTLLAGVDSTESPDGSDQSNPVAEISVVRALETGRLLAAYRRVVNGSGAGVVAVRDVLEVSGQRDLTERLAFGLGARAYRTDALSGDAPNFDERDYIQFRAELAWRATRNWTFELDYRFTELDRTTFPTSADSNRVELWVVYNPVF